MHILHCISMHMKSCKGTMHLITPSSFVSFQAMIDGDTTCPRLMKLGLFYQAILLLKETIATLSYISAQNIIATLQTIVTIYDCNALMKATLRMPLYIMFFSFHMESLAGIRDYEHQRLQSGSLSCSTRLIAFRPVQMSSPPYSEDVVCFKHIWLICLHALIRNAFVSYELNNRGFV